MSPAVAVCRVIESHLRRAAASRSPGAAAPCFYSESRSSRPPIRTLSPWPAAEDSRWSVATENSDSRNAPPSRWRCSARSPGRTPAQLWRRRRLAVIILRLGWLPRIPCVVIGQVDDQIRSMIPDRKRDFEIGAKELSNENVSTEDFDHLIVPALSDSRSWG